MSVKELLDPATFKHTMKSLFDFGISKPSINVAEMPSVENNAYAKLIDAESALGRTLFGPIPAGHRREFFEHKKNVWIWHDSWLDEKGGTQGVTIRYEVRPAGVYKKYEGGNYTRIEGGELDNFRRAARMYLELIKANIYNR